MREGWQHTTLGEVVSFKGGGTPSTEKPSYWNGDIPWVSPKDMKTSEIGDSIDKITPEAIDNSAASLIPKNAILIVVRSGILARTIPVGITTRSLVVNQDIKALCPAKDVDPRFLHYFMQASESNILNLVTRGATVHRVSTDSLRALKFPKPPLPEQQRIVAILDEAFAGLKTATANAEKNLKNAHELFDGYLNSIFGAVSQGWVDSHLMKWQLNSGGESQSIAHAMIRRYMMESIPSFKPETFGTQTIWSSNIRRPITRRVWRRVSFGRKEQFALRLLQI